MGLRLALALGIRSICVFGDSRLVINQMNCEWRVRHPMMIALWKIATSLKKQFHHISIAFTPRNKNKLADQAANDVINNWLCFQTTWV